MRYSNNNIYIINNNGKMITLVKTVPWVNTVQLCNITHLQVTRAVHNEMKRRNACNTFLIISLRSNRCEICAHVCSYETTIGNYGFSFSTHLKIGYTYHTFILDNFHSTVQNEAKSWELTHVKILTANFWKHQLMLLQFHQNKNQFHIRIKKRLVLLV